VLAAAGYTSSEQLSLYDALLDGKLEVLDEVASRIDGSRNMLGALHAVDGDGSAYIRSVQG